jgi:phosphoglycerate dehydrogenase-like enzyme
VVRITDAQGPSFFELLCKRNIPFVDATAAWGQSVAECGFALVLCALRKLPQWHARLADRSFDWKFPYWQFCDDPAFVNGELATKTVGIIGLGQIGMRLARWCDAFGATVLAYDPFAPAERFADAGAAKRDVDTLISEVDILIIAVPPTPSAANLVSSERIMRLAQGTIVMTITRTHAVDVSTLRKRVLANELFWASDVYDIEPLPNDDPILGRGNVMHVPHIAGRTRDANLRLADIIADDFIRVFNGHTPQYALKPNAVSIRTEKAPKLTEAANKTDAGDA